MNIDNYREQITNIDTQIIALLARRLDTAREICDMKRKTRSPITDKEQEKKVIERWVGELEESGVSANAIEQLVESIISMSKEVQIGIRYKNVMLKSVKSC